MMKLRQENGLRIFGGCCGTDYRHMEEVARLLTAGADLSKVSQLVTDCCLQVLMLLGRINLNK